jgi:hypothetical protein
MSGVCRKRLFFEGTEKGRFYLFSALEAMSSAIASSSMDFFQQPLGLVAFSILKLK